jgi:hypothetical protein
MPPSMAGLFVVRYVKLRRGTRLEKKVGKKYHSVFFVDKNTLVKIRPAKEASHSRLDGETLLPL